MKINESKVLIFNKSKKYAFPPEFSFQDGQILEVIEQTRILGIQLSTDLRWHNNSKAMYDKALSRMWLLRRMKSLKLEPEIILEYYIKEIRSIVEQGVPIWNSGITKGQVNDIEKVQKIALKIILSNEYKTYSLACEKFKLETLSSRRTTISTNYAIKLYKSQRSAEFFTPAYTKVNSRHHSKLVIENKLDSLIRISQKSSKGRLPYSYFNVTCG